MEDILTFNLNSEEIIYLTKIDNRLGKLISIIGDYTLSLRTDYFSSLIKSIIGQQLSAVVAGRIWSKLYSKIAPVTPEKIIKLDDVTLKSFGISSPKIKYIKELSSQIVQNNLDLDNLKSLNDEDVITCLTSVKGIGIWTAKMFCIFSLGRGNVWAFEDVGLRRAIKWLYNLEINPDKDLMISLGDKWSPYKTVASLYLWEAINRNIISNYQIND